MRCAFCGLNPPLREWAEVKVACISSSCSETQGRECPGCHKAVGHTWLDTQEEWRDSKYYIRGGGGNMREIKFRGKTLQDGNWVYGHYFSETYDDGKTDHYIHRTNEAGNARFKVDPETVGQFVCDCKGVDVYEGDIFETRRPFNRPDMTGDQVSHYVVRWGKHREPIDNEEILYVGFDFDYECDEWTSLVGNIHDNPELLKAGDGQR